MPDADGNVKGISVPRVPWHLEDLDPPINYELGVAVLRAARDVEDEPDYPEPTYGPHWPD